MFLLTLFRAWHEETLKTFKLNTVEFLQEETRDLPASAEVEMFYQQVKKLEHDTLRLAEQLNRLDEKVK